MPRANAWMVITARRVLRYSRRTRTIRYCFWQISAARVRRSISAYLRENERTRAVSSEKRASEVQSKRRLLKHSPACQVTPAVSLQNDSRLADLAVPNSLQPSSHGLLDLNAGEAELISSELLQIGHLTCPEENLRLSKLELIRVLKERRRVTINRFIHDKYLWKKNITNIFHVGEGKYLTPEHCSCVQNAILDKQ